jgi:hypothetical protein
MVGRGTASDIGAPGEIEWLEKAKVLVADEDQSMTLFSAVNAGADRVGRASQELQMLLKGLAGNWKLIDQMICRDDELFLRQGERAASANARRTTPVRRGTFDKAFDVQEATGAAASLAGAEGIMAKESKRAAIGFRVGRHG